MNEEGERMSRLKEVNSDWIIRRLERWGQRVRPLPSPPLHPAHPLSQALLQRPPVCA